MKLEIRSISIGELPEFTASEAFQRLDPMPITPERAISQSRNPRAREEDPALWIAESDRGQICGFIGSLPAYDVHNRQRLGYNSGWWVDPRKGRSVALPLFSRFLGYWDGQVAFADMTPSTHAIIGQLGFCHTRTNNLFQGYIRLSRRRWAGRPGTGGVLSVLLAPVSVVLNFIQHTRLSLTVRLDETLSVESRKRIDEEIYSFISSHQKKDFLQRSLEDYRWIEAHSWLRKREKGPKQGEGKYPFSRDVFDFQRDWLISRRNGLITSVMMTSRREGDLKVLYYFGDRPLDALDILKYRILKDKRIESVILDHPRLMEHIRKLRSVCFFSRLRTRYVGVSRKVLGELPEDMVIQLGDGDAVFT